MKISTVGQILFVCLFACPSMGEQNEAYAQEKTSEGKRVGSVDHNRTGQGGHRKRRAPGEEQMELLRFFLEASPERLQVIRKTIERVEKMTPEERKSMRARLKRFREKAPAARTKMMKDFHMRQDLLNRYWKTLDPETRVREMNHFYQLSLPQRPKYFEKVRKSQRSAEAIKSKSKEDSPE